MKLKIEALLIMLAVFGVTMWSLGSVTFALAAALISIIMRFPRQNMWLDNVSGKTCLVVGSAVSFVYYLMLSNAVPVFWNWEMCFVPLILIIIMLVMRRGNDLAEIFLFAIVIAVRYISEDHSLLDLMSWTIWTTMLLEGVSFLTAGVVRAFSSDF